MTKRSPSLRRRLVVLAVLAVAATAGALVLYVRHQERQSRIAACRQQRSEIARFRKDSVDAPLAAMRRMRLNSDQAATLRRVDREAYVRYVQAFGEQVDKVATAADRLGEMVDTYRAGDCLGVK